MIIANVDKNHNGNLDMAKSYATRCAEAGVDAILYKSLDIKAFDPQIIDFFDDVAANQLKSKEQHDLGLILTINEHVELVKHCKNKNLLVIANPFDAASADFFEFIGYDIFRVSSADLTNHSFLKHLSLKGKPLIINTGMATLAEVDEAIRTVKSMGSDDIALMHGTSHYPTPYSDANLKAIETMSKAFQLPVGYSDHTLGFVTPLAACALGAQLIEKHVTSSKNLPGRKHKIALDGSDLKIFVRSVRVVEDSLGTGLKEPAEKEMELRSELRKSVKARIDLHEGDIVKPEMLCVLPPGTGINPDNLPKVLGRRMKCDIPAGTLIKWEYLD